MAQDRPRHPKLLPAETMRDALAAARRACRDLGGATTLAFLVVLGKEVFHTVLVDPTRPVRFQPDVFLVDLAATILLAPYWMAMFRRILGAGGGPADVATGRAGPFQAFLALELFWLLIGNLLDRALSPGGIAQGQMTAGLLAWIAILLAQIWTSLLAPALAMGAPDATLRDVVAITRGSAARLGLVLVATILPLGILGRMLGGPERAGVAMPPAGLAFRIVASACIDMALLVLTTALLAEIYRRLRRAAPHEPRTRPSE